MLLRFSSSVLLVSAGGWLLSSSTAIDARLLAPRAGHGVDARSLESDCVKGIDVANGDYSSWPDLFRLTSDCPEDPTLSNRDAAADPVDPSVLLAAGIGYKYLDPAGFTYPNRTKQVPWTPPSNGTNDPFLQEFRDDNDFQYADIVVVSAFNEGFYEEHIHPGGDEVRYIIDGKGYFDIRDVNDEWVRMHARAGDFLIFPSGIEHRFSVDETLYVQAMRLFPGSGTPDWTAVPSDQVQSNNTARIGYIETYLCGIDPDEDHGHEHGCTKPAASDDETSAVANLTASDNESSASADLMNVLDEATDAIDTLTASDDETSAVANLTASDDESSASADLMNVLDDATDAIDNLTASDDETGAVANLTASDDESGDVANLTASDDESSASADLTNVLDEASDAIDNLTASDDKSGASADLTNVLDDVSDAIDNLTASDDETGASANLTASDDESGAIANLTASDDESGASANANALAWIIPGVVVAASLLALN